MIFVLFTGRLYARVPAAELRGSINRPLLEISHTHTNTHTYINAFVYVYTYIDTHTRSRSDSPTYSPFGSRPLARISFPFRLPLPLDSSRGVQGSPLIFQELANVEEKSE